MRLAQGEGFVFRGFLEGSRSGERTIFLRHDVDYSLSIAVELARINASLGVRGTFFVLLRSQVYNLLSRWTLDQVKEIHASGQRLAFHCALPPSTPANQESMARMMFNDFGIVKSNIPEIEQVFSWHNPTQEVLDQSLNFDLPREQHAFGYQLLKHWSQQEPIDAKDRNFSHQILNGFPA